VSECEKGEGKRERNSDSERVTQLNVATVRVDTVSVNPEAKRHVRVSKQVQDSTTANVGVLVATSTVKGDVYYTSERISSHEVDSIRRTNGSCSVEHL
jgi:hypothetical protein